MSTFTADELEQASRAIFDRHVGKDLPTLIVSLHLELAQRIAALEGRLEKPEARKR